MITFSRMGSIARDMDANDRLRIIHDFFRQGEETYFNFDFKEMMKKMNKSGMMNMPGMKGGKMPRGVDFSKMGF